MSWAILFCSSKDNQVEFHGKKIGSLRFFEGIYQLNWQTFLPYKLYPAQGNENQLTSYSQSFTQKFHKNCSSRSDEFCYKHRNARILYIRWACIEKYTQPVLHIIGTMKSTKFITNPKTAIDARVLRSISQIVKYRTVTVANMAQGCHCCSQRITDFNGRRAIRQPSSSLFSFFTCCS